MEPKISVLFGTLRVLKTMRRPMQCMHFVSFYLLLLAVHEAELAG